MRIRVFITCLFIGFVYLTGCAQPASQTLPAGWPVVALNLPANSVIVVNTTTHKTRQDSIPACRAYIVGFDNAAPFAQVRTHVESCLRIDGYLVFNDTTDPVPTLHCISPDGLIAVRLAHTSSLKMNNTGLIKAPIGDYSLQVIEYDHPYSFMLDNSQDKL